MKKAEPTENPNGAEVNGNELTPFDAGYPSEEPLAGRWVAWNRGARKILAVADTLDELMGALPQSDQTDCEIGMAPGFSDRVLARPLQLMPGESPDVLEDVKDVIGEGCEQWLDTPHPRLGLRTPRSVVGTDMEKLLRYLLRAYRLGIPT